MGDGRGGVWDEFQVADWVTWWLVVPFLEIGTGGKNQKEMQSGDEQFHVFILA